MPTKKPTLDVHRVPMERDVPSRRAAPQPSPASHATPRNRALEIGTNARGFEEPLTGAYNAQGGAPTSVLGGSFEQEQMRRDANRIVPAARAGDAEPSGFRLKPYKAG